MSRKERRCSSCDAYQYDEDRLTPVRGFGRLCVPCLQCRECDSKLPPAFLGLKGYSGRAKLCTKCHRKMRKERRAVERIQVPRLRGSLRALIGDQSTKDSRLKTYVRLEKLNTNGTLTIIEFGQFVGDRIHSATKRIVYGIRTANFKTKPNLEKQIEKKSIEIKREMRIDIEKNPDFDTYRMLTRPVNLLRRLGFRVTAKRSRGTYSAPDNYEAMSYAEEFVSRRNEIVEAALPANQKKLLERLEARRDKNLEKLDRYEGEILNQAIEEAKTPAGLEAMISGYEE